MARSDRLQVTVTREMTIALDLLAARTGQSRSGQAALMLRQALSRTIASEAVQVRYREHVARRTSAEWRDDQAVETAVERDLPESVIRTEEAEDAIEKARRGRWPASVALQAKTEGRRG